MTPSPLISVISVNYNQEEHTVEFLDSIFASGYDNIEVIIVDNASKEPINKGLEAKYQNLKIIHSAENLGFAGGNNLGVLDAKGDYLFFLNNDTLVIPDFFHSLVAFLEEHPEVGMVSPKIIYHASGYIQYAGYSPINPLTGRGSPIGGKEPDDGQYDMVCETAYAHGAAMAASRKVIEEVGVMNEEYFLYYEELDWSESIKRAGYKIYYYGKTLIRHKESMSVGKESPLKTYYMNRNRILFQRRNVSGIKFLISILFFLLFSLPKSTLSYLLKGKQQHLSNLWKGVLWHLNKKYVYRHPK